MHEQHLYLIWTRCNEEEFCFVRTNKFGINISINRIFILFGIIFFVCLGRRKIFEEDKQNLYLIWKIREEKLYQKIIRRGRVEVFCKREINIWIGRVFSKSGEILYAEQN